MLYSRAPLRRFFIIVLAGLLIAVGFLLAVGFAAALADVVPGPGDAASVPDGPALTALPLNIVVVSVVMTAVGYVLNHFLPWKSDQAKGVANAVYQAVGLVLYDLATSSDFGFNEQTGTAFVVAMSTWALAHGLLFKPTGWNMTLGGGSNRTKTGVVPNTTLRGVSGE